MTDSQGPLFGGADRARHYVEPGDVDMPERSLAPPDVGGAQSRGRRRRHVQPVESIEAEAEVASGPIVQPMPANDLAAGLPPAPVAPTQATRARRGWRGLLARLGMPLAPGAAEQAELERVAVVDADQTLIRSVSLPGFSTILVAQRKGGVGKTPVSLLLAGVVAMLRGGNIVAVEVSDDVGTLALRAEGAPSQGLGELLGQPRFVMNAGELDAYTSRQTSLAAVLGSPTSRPPLTAEDVHSLHRLLQGRYSMQVLDSGNVHTSPAFEAALELAQALVIPISDSVAAVQEARALIHMLEQTPHGQRLARNAVIVRLRYLPVDDDTQARIDYALQGLGVAHVIDVPHDDHIAENGELSVSRLAPATHDAFLRVAAATLHSIQHTTR